LTVSRGLAIAGSRLFISVYVIGGFMPNWCENCLKIDAPMEVKKQIIADCITPDEYGRPRLDFEKIVPVSDSEKANLVHLDMWGTKWNSVDCSIDDEPPKEGPLEIDMMTAWSPPIPILKALIEKYHCHAELAYYEPGMNFRGIASGNWQDGEALVADQSWDMTDKDYAELDLLPSAD
jgi:hypothetical protein